MWKWLNCYLSGRHDFGVTCASGSIFLRCIHCGKRSNGWDVHTDHQGMVPSPASRPTVPHVLPFSRQSVRPSRP
jgi:hypothetical protein